MNLVRLTLDTAGLSLQPAMVHIFGIRWLALNAENGRKLLLSLGFSATVVVLRYALKALTKLLVRGAADRITMGGVRGDVIALGFIRTTIMEMSQVANADPAMWVKSRQFTGRIVTVSNAKVFDEPVYNYTRDFPYIWDEIRAFIRRTYAP